MWGLCVCGGDVGAGCVYGLGVQVVGVGAVYRCCVQVLCAVYRCCVLCTGAVCWCCGGGGGGGAVWYVRRQGGGEV